MASLGIVVSLLALSLYLLWGLITSVTRRGKKKKNLPPGPRRLPVIGNLHLLGNHPHKSLAKLAKTHGPIMSLKLGQKTMIAISSSAVAEEVLRKPKNIDIFSGRLISDVAKSLSKQSVVWMPVGPEWKLLRKIMATHIFSGGSLDGSQRLRSEKVNDLISFCERSREAGEAVDIGRAGFRFSLNMLSNIMFSMNLTDPMTDSGKDFKNLVWEILEAFVKPNVVDFFPVFAMLDPQGIRRRVDVLVGKMMEMFTRIITERLETRKYGSGRLNKDVLDNLLDLSSENPDQINASVIPYFFLDLFLAGTDTTSTTLEWAMSELLANPGTLKKLQAELGEVIGRGKAVEESHLPSLPYLQCVVKETLRKNPSAPFVVREAIADVEVCGYLVPEGSRVFVNAWAIGRDETVWEDPCHFKPERFLEMERDLIMSWGSDPTLIPFGAGRRICPGMSLAVRAVPVVLGSLINVFDWELEGELDMEDKFGLTLLKARPLRAIPLAI